MSDLTPEKLAELRRLLDEGSARPWVAFRANDPNPGWRGWVGVTRDLDVDYDPDIFASQRCAPRDAALIAAAVNALPALLDAAAERDALSAAVERVRRLHARESFWQYDRDQEYSYPTREEAADESGCDCPYAPEPSADLAHTPECLATITHFDVCSECARIEYADADRQSHGEFSGYAEAMWPCPTIRALDATPDTGGES